MRDLGDRLLVEPPASQELAGLGLPDELMLVEVAIGEGRRLTDVVKQTGEAEHEVGRRRRIACRDGVLEHVLRDGFVLRDRLRDLELGEDHREQAEVRHLAERRRRPRRAEDLHHLLLDTLA